MRDFLNLFTIVGAAILLWGKIAGLVLAGALTIYGCWIVANRLQGLLTRRMQWQQYGPNKS